jgi:DNA-binding transcriptional LysR family regulator
MSRIIAELERDVGTPLFVRDNRQVRITSAGTLLLPMAESIVQEFDLWIERSRRIARGELGALHLGFYGPTFYKTPQLAQAHRIFKLRHPNVQVEIAKLFTSEIPAALRGHRADVAFGREIS